MKVYLRGFFYSNLGDDLFVHILAERYPDIDFCLIVNSEYERAYSNEKNIRVVKLNKLRRGIQKIKNLINLEDIYVKEEKKADLSIVIGGSMFQENPKDDGAVKRLNSFPGKYSDTYIVGINFGPYQTERYKSAVANYLKIAKDVCFRDYKSYCFFNDLENVRWEQDIVFGIKAVVPKMRSEQKICVISVIDFKDRNYLSEYWDDYLEFIVKIVEKNCRKGFNIHLVSFCKMEGDEEAIEEVIKNVNESFKKQISFLKYNGENWKEIVIDISCAEYIIATRFHSMILGFAFQIPTLPIIYNEKCRNVLVDLGYGNAGIEVEDLKKVDICENDFIKINKIENIEKSSMNQFCMLDKVFRRN